MRDNLGRELSEIYLTIVKNNDGHDKWYKNKNYTEESITFSRCFGKVTSGLEINDNNEKDYNIHALHNLDVSLAESVGEDSGNVDSNIELMAPFKNIFKEIDGGYELPNVLENDITIKQDIFLGDLVEFSPNTLEETVLEEVMHRFNTAQRETLDKDFRNIYYDEILSDDFDINSDGFKIETKRFNAFYDSDISREQFIYSLPANIAPEGYFYRAHYKIPLKYYNTKVNNGAHTLIKVNEFYKKLNGIFMLKTIKNYFPEVYKPLFIYDRATGEQHDAIITNVSGDNFTEITIKCDNIEENSSLYTLNERYIIFKPNVEKPDGAYELNDGTGRYVWRDGYEDIQYEGTDIDEYTFTNGAHYIKRGINFYLKRQDPDGRYGLSLSSNNAFYYNNLGIDGFAVDYSGVEIENPQDFKMC